MKPFDTIHGKQFDVAHGRPKIFVAMSGGVDSSVAAALLARSGDFEVVGVHMKCWSEGEYCTSERDAEDARRVAEKIGIPFYTFDFEKEYREKVFSYMVKEYSAGRTPNPDVMCNKVIKFGIFLGKALSLGADFVATGHYVKINKSFSKANAALLSKDKTSVALLAAKDSTKDQSYFLWTLTQEQLKHCLFPIGDYLKSEVRAMAKEFDLPTAAKKDSQGLCFVGEIKFDDFLREVLPMREGVVVTTSGKEVGKHDGVEFYTIGQRRGIKIGGGIPYYVAEKKFDTNTLVVAEGPYDDGLFQSELSVSDVSWISGEAPQLPLECEARIRYRQPLQKATILNFESGIRNNGTKYTSMIHNSQLIIHFKEPQRAVTPGQSVVFYKNSSFNTAQGKEMLGGGIISS